MPRLCSDQSAAVIMRPYVHAGEILCLCDKIDPRGGLPVEALSVGQQVHDMTLCYCR